MGEATGEWEEPDDGEEDGESGYHFGVDETALVPAASVVDVVQVLAVDSGDDGAEGQLR